MPNISSIFAFLSYAAFSIGTPVGSSPNIANSPFDEFLDRHMTVNSSPSNLTSGMFARYSPSVPRLPPSVVEAGFSPPLRHPAATAVTVAAIAEPPLLFFFHRDETISLIFAVRASAKPHCAEYEGCFHPPLMSGLTSRRNMFRSPVFSMAFPITSVNPVNR